MIIKNIDGLGLLSSIKNGSVDLILTDPPYITSRKTGMDKWVDHVTKQNKKDAKNIKTEEQWEKLKTPDEWKEWFANSKTLEKDQKEKLRKMKSDFLKYGSIYGSKYAVRTDYGSWDSEFTLEDLGLFINHFYRVLKPGGTCIVFFDI